MEHAHFKIFVHKDVPRLRYILNIIFNNILGLDYEVVTDKRKIGKNHAINYSDENIHGCFKIEPYTILFEKDVIQHKIEIFNWKGLPAFFSCSSDSDMPFDVFAASFYLISRYEEYLDIQADEHGRFREEDSIAYKNGFLQSPVIDLWTRELSLLLLKKFQTLSFKKNEFKSLITIDIDQAFAYKGKGFLRTAAGITKDIIKRDWNAGERLRCATGKITDPFDVFEYITCNIETKKSEALFFFPVGKLSEFDKNPSPRNLQYRNLINKISNKFRIGIHPSYCSAGRDILFKKELKQIENISGKAIDCSRQHFLRLRFPDTFQTLVKYNIHEDYSLGYAREPGFRASIARPFKFFDLTKDEETTLTLIPFQIMDGSLLNRSALPEEAIDIIKNIMNETRNVGGLFVSIWHNTSLTDKGEWKDWKSVFEFILNQQNL
jgi:hypothetical protein